MTERFTIVVRKGALQIAARSASIDRPAPHVFFLTGFEGVVNFFCGAKPCNARGFHTDAVQNGGAQ